MPTIRITPANCKPSTIVTTIRVDSSVLMSPMRMPLTPANSASKVTSLNSFHSSASRHKIIRPTPTTKRTSLSMMAAACPKMK